MQRHKAPKNNRGVWRCEPCKESKHDICQNSYKGRPCFCKANGHLDIK